MKKLLSLAVIAATLVFLLSGCGLLSKSDFIFEEIKDGAEYAFGGVKYSGSGEMEVTVPGEYKGKPVTAIADYAFNGAQYITKITLPSGITDIGNCAFQSFGNIQNLMLPDGVVRIGDSAFRHSDFDAITIPASVTSIGAYALSNCENLTEIHFGGMMSQWEAIEKRGWWKSSSAFTVYCTDGNLDLTA